MEDVEFAYRLALCGARWAFSRRAAAYHLYHDRAMTPDRFAGWQANLRQFQAKHPHVAVQRLSTLEPAFDPRIKGDWMALYEEFNCTEPVSRPAVVLQLASFLGDPIRLLQNLVYRQQAADRDLFVIDREERSDHEILLTAACPALAVRFYTPADWELVGPAIRTRYADQGQTVEEIDMLVAGGTV